MANAADATVNRKARVGTVVSDRNDKTIVVEIERATRHRLYRKVIRRRKKYHVHDPQNEATIGDLVRVEECRPISKKKRWQLVEVLTEREVAEIAPEAIDESLVDEMQRTAARAAAQEAEEAGEAALEGEAPATEEAAETPAAEAPAEEPSDEAPAADDAGKTEGDEQGDEERTE
jgi:small subunit ribosomal protein S17